MVDRDKRNHPRDDRFAGKPLEAIVEDGNGYNAISGATCVNHSVGGMQITADLSPNLAVGKVVVLFVSDGDSPGKKRLETVIAWMSEHEGRARLGCEFTYPIVGIHFYL